MISSPTTNKSTVTTTKPLSATANAPIRAMHTVGSATSGLLEQTRPFVGQTQGTVKRRRRVANRFGSHMGVHSAAPGRNTPPYRHGRISTLHTG